MCFWIRWLCFVLLLWTLELGLLPCGWKWAGVRGGRGKGQVFSGGEGSRQVCRGKGQVCVGEGEAGRCAAGKGEAGRCAGGRGRCAGGEGEGGRCADGSLHGARTALCACCPQGPKRGSAWPVDFYDLVTYCGVRTQGMFAVACCQGAVWMAGPWSVMRGGQCRVVKTGSSCTEGEEDWNVELLLRLLCVGFPGGTPAAGARHPHAFVALAAGL